jgi:succinate-acetate transporter protein
MIIKILLGWIIFDFIVYTVMWFETIYYKKNLPAVFRKLLLAFTEEEE